MQLTLRMAKLMIQHLVLKELLASAVSSVQTSTLMRKNVTCVDNTITIVNKPITLKKPCYVVGFGKAAFGMAAELLEILGDNLHAGVLTIPIGSVQRHKMALSVEQQERFDQKFTVYEGAKHNLPDEDALRGAQEIAKLCTSLKVDDVLLVLVSGGGSALLPLPKDDISLQEKHDVINRMFRHGASIHEVNCFRKQVSQLKGGGLARLADPAQVVSLILSDVVGDHLDVIASGATVVTGRDRCQDLMQILQRFKVLEGMSPAMMDAVKSAPSAAAEADKFLNVTNYIIGNNSTARNAARERALELGYYAAVVTSDIEGSVQDIAEMYGDMARYFLNIEHLHIDSFRFLAGTSQKMMVKMERIRHTRGNKPLCLIFGGEPTIVVENEQGVGGRNLHLALELAVKLNDTKGVYFLSFGTDGIDGPTDAAGAISPFGMSGADYVEAQAVLKRNDSYTFFTQRKPNFLIKTGHTGTNVMDIHIMIIANRT